MSIPPHIIMSFLPLLDMTVGIAAMIDKSRFCTFRSRINHFSVMIIQEIKVLFVHVVGTHAFLAELLRDDFAAVLDDELAFFDVGQCT